MLSLRSKNSIHSFSPVKKRLMRDFKKLQQDPPTGISEVAQDNNIMLWNAVIFRPDNTHWDGGSWWPGRIMGLDDLSEGCLVFLRSSNPVNLLGREDAGVLMQNPGEFVVTFPRV
ncbi:uncharacterized protein LOC111283106 [Durio zibethinus]|uniref:Uncharacterized protein LOC111283106 n=1 Tax=Durio zibethinus TaxID=66656 RepID=A0A6P5XG55_DURZI|nr:uncharacterized protein LOC111283106 [Durio zibethinus]